MTELAKNSPKPEKENGDYISRRDAIEKLRVENGIVDDCLIYVPLRDVRNHLRSLPPAQPKRKTGQWERHYVRPNVYADLCWHCSECGYKSSDSWANKFNYCPNCGAKMEEEDGKIEESGN